VPLAQTLVLWSNQKRSEVHDSDSLIILFLHRCWSLEESSSLPIVVVARGLDELLTNSEADIDQIE